MQYSVRILDPLSPGWPGTAYALHEIETVEANSPKEAWEKCSLFGQYEPYFERNGEAMIGDSVRAHVEIVPLIVE